MTLGSIGRSYPASTAVQREMTLGQIAERMKFAQMSGAVGPRPTNTYGKVAAVYSCVKAKADALAGMPLVVSTSDDQVVESGPLAELAECPNPRMTGRAFRRATSAMIDLFGRVHWVLTLDAGDRPIEVYPVAGPQMEPVKDRATGELLAWKYHAAGKLRGQAELLPLDQVHSIIDPDYDDWNDPLSGLSPRRAVNYAISQYVKADIANESSLDHGLEPGAALTTDHNLDDAQRHDLHDQIKERHEGIHNRRKWLLMEGGLKYQPFPVNFKDAEFSELKRMSRTDICAAFNVPPAVVGFYEDSNYAHADAADRQFWINTMLPRAAWIAEEWTVGVLDRFKGDRSLRLADARRSSATIREANCRGFIDARRSATRSGRRHFAWFDSSGVPAVQRAMLEQAEQVKTWHAMGVPLNAILRATDAPFEEVPWGHTVRVPIGTIDILDDGLAGPDPTDPDGGEPSGGEPIDQDTLIAPVRPRAALPGPAAPGRGVEGRRGREGPPVGSVAR